MTKPTLNLAGAMALKLAADQSSAVLTSYELAVHLFEIYQRKEQQGQRVRVTKALPDTTDLKRVKDALVRNGIIQEHGEIGTGVSRYLARPYFEAEQIICGVDPFAYISHLSAMTHYGLTDRFPQIIFATTWDAPQWRLHAATLMEKMLGDGLSAYLNAHLPKLRRITLKTVQKKPVNMYTSSSAGSFIHVREKDFRVSSIGRTFLDMLRRPDLCNGMAHVIDVFEQHAERYLSLIIEEMSLHGTQIEQARAGYILEEICDLQHPKIDEWVAKVQRGGSRKLDPAAEYSPDFSEKWCISLNVIR